MNFKEFYNTYYLEEYSLGEFTFGFELEGFTNNEIKLVECIRDSFKEELKNKKNSDLLTSDGSLVHNNDECDECYGDGEIRCSECGGEGEISETCEDCDGSGKDEDGDTCPSCDGSGNITLTCSECDGSGSVTCPTCGGSGGGESFDDSGMSGDEGSFEFPSPPLALTPANIIRVIKFLETLRDEDIVFVNKTCGFHCHIGYPSKFNISQEWLWIITKLIEGAEKINGDDPINFISHMKNIDFDNSNYAPTQTFNMVRRRCLQNRDNTKEEIIDDLVSNLYKGTKFIMLGQHRQGTLEWRGPRQFFDKDKGIKEFFINHLIPFIKWMAKVSAQQTATFNNVVISKQDVFNKAKAHGLSKYEKNAKYKKDKRFDWGTVDPKAIDKAMKLFPWLTKAKFEYLNFNITPDNKLEMRGGVWKDGNFYGVMCGGSFDAPKANFKGEWDNGVYHQHAIVDPKKYSSVFNSFSQKTVSEQMDAIDKME